ncbi:hypothetical protein TWF730_002380 [Orbilia blumenaviensis]|uniref:Uncharacterized protein n=1 Tax=Orbilia blumenaviensis TaxID=1796055 RepID=A0AAV9UE88_9PEZI
MSQRSSVFGGSMMSAASAPTPRRFPSALERNNPDVRPSLLALVDTSKPITQQVDQIKAATQRESGSPDPRVTSGGSDAFRGSQRGPPRSNASHSVRSFGSYGLTPSARRQTSGELGKGDDGLIVAMRKKAAEERRKKHLREVRASQAGSTVSRGLFGASRVSNSSFGISRIGLHSTTGSGIRPASSLMGSRSQPLPPSTSTPRANATTTTTMSPHRFEDLRYVQEVLARSRGTSAVSSRASSPEQTKPASPYASLAARARGALLENTKEIQEAKAEKRKEEARKRELERERQRRDARLETLAKLAAEEERERTRREEEVLSAGNRKRDAAGTLRYSPEDAVENSLHPYGTKPKDPRKRSFSAGSPTKTPQPAKRSRSSEPEGSTDRKLMPPPPAPSSHSQPAAVAAATLSPPFPAAVSPGLGPEQMIVEEPEDIGEDADFGNFVEAVLDEGPANHSVEPEIGMPVSLFMPSNAPLGGAPIARDFAYPGGPVFVPEPVHAGSDTEPDQDEDEDDEEEEEQEFLDPKKDVRQPEVVSLLDSDDEEEDNGEEGAFEGFGEYEDEEEEEGDGEESEEEEEDDDEEEEEESSSDEDDDSEEEVREPTIIAIYSSPVPESVGDEDEVPETNGLMEPIPDDAVADAQAFDAQEVVLAPVKTRAGRSRSSTAQSSSQEKVWMRDSGGRLMRSASPEEAGIAPVALAVPVTADDDHDAPNEEISALEPPIDPLLNTGLEPVVPVAAAAHAH